MIRALGLVALLLAAPAGNAQEVIADLDQTSVSIDSTFAGQEILVFGAFTADAPPDIVVTVAGPPEPATIRRKARRMGIWVNAAQAEVSAPAFYAVASTAPLDAILSPAADLRHAITLPHAVRSVAAGPGQSRSFVEALVRIRTASGAYRRDGEAVEVIGGRLFRTAIALPSDLTEGDYAARIFLLSEGAVIADYATALEVRKVGLERFLYRLAHDRPLVYGLMSLAIAIAAGWGAAGLFGLFRR
ncbi:uncharacterized protein (TIGR02186 family) [Hasllibacter halocynthiae]|uniref:Uncharacterized protein (TIGR02186 family) n=1 Tax=Hasllibacter halocynthiae TaxID=595589 RepID=A0A2T0X315_9RHOB|nr:TIGR02186 family protein [Hasllibacter halocynthiae]PRY93321.1 uncharacterized protein (TIGR02186 family) [Hasllibacter halocynthiae]